MRRLILLFVTFTCLYAMGQVSERATAGFEFPFQPGDAQWKSYSSAKERVAAPESHFPKGIFDAKIKAI